jgi:uncharacterized membrane protein
MNRTVLWVIAVVLIGIGVHISAVLAVPYLAKDDAWGRLARLGGLNETAMLPAPTPFGQVLPEMDPNLRYAMCRFDLGEGPLRVEAVLPPAYWSAAFYDRNAANFYTLNNRAGRDGKLNFWVATERQLLGLAPDDPLAVTEELVVKAPAAQGLILFRGLVADPSFQREVEAALEATVCRRAGERAGEPAP